MCVVFRASQSSRVSATETQDEPEAADPVQHGPAAGARAPVPAETVPVHRGTGRVLQLAQPHGDPGQDLVPEPASQSQAAPGGRAREAEDGRETDASSGLRDLVPDRSRFIFRIARVPQTLAELESAGPVHTHGIQHVPFSLKDDKHYSSAAVEMVIIIIAFHTGLSYEHGL